jgi:protein-tyrosine phosphatase
MKPDLFWIPGPWRGSLAVVARPRGGDWLEDEARAWKGAGLDVVVSLLENEEAADLDLTKEREVVESNRIGFISFPIPDRGVPGSQKDALLLLATLTNLLEKGQNVGIHCRQSVGRSGLIAAALLVRSGTETDRAVETVSAARGQTIPETAGQMEWIKHLPTGDVVLT